MTSLRSIIDIITEGQELDESIHLKTFEQIAKESNTVEQFIKKTDGKDVLYRGHSGDNVQNNSFMTDYVGHAYEYGDYVDAYEVNFNDVLNFNDRVFDSMRDDYRDMSNKEFALAYKNALNGHRFEGEFKKAYTAAWKIIKSDTPYSEISADFSVNDKIVPLMQQWAVDKHHKNIIMFLGNDYGDYGGQNEFVVKDVSKLVDLRKLYTQVHGQ